MKRTNSTNSSRYVMGLFGLLLIVAGCEADPADGDAATERSEQPNIVYILADDLGYGELGVYGQELIETPNIDALAERGMMFTNHYAGSPVCAPSRNVLLTGRHSGNVTRRSNSEAAPRELSFDLEAILADSTLEGQGPIPADTRTFAEILQEHGYTTGAFGKWGLGGPGPDGHPNRHGFDVFYGFICQRQAHNYFPTHLWHNDRRVMLDNDPVNPHQELSEDLDPYDPESYALFHDQPDYSAELIHEETLRFLDDHHADPFFLYVPTPIPHVSLQAPQRWIDYYVEKFGDEEPYLGGSYVPVRYPNATYAAMISYLDEQVGEIVDRLKEHGVYEDTVIMFTSDNGPTFAGGVDPHYFDSAAPFPNEQGRTKAYVFEGGIRVPMIAVWEGVIEPGSSTDHISAFWDIFPTVTDLIDAEAPANIDGISFLPTLLGEDENQQRHDYLYWEFPAYGGQQAVRMDNWKAVRTGIISDNNLEIELYDLGNDIRESNDVSDDYPEVTDRMREIMQEARSVPELERFRMSALGD